MPFNLPSPSDFKGFDPQGHVTVYHRNLPHWRQPGATYFVTFHLADALPSAKRQELASIRREWELANPPPRTEEAWKLYAKKVFTIAERCLDTGLGACWFAQDRYATELSRSILHFHAKRYTIGAYVLMGNHCHLTIRPEEGYKLEDAIGAIKGVVSKFVGRHQAIQGALWQEESYDRIIRDEEHLYRVVQYIGANPQRAKIPRKNWKRWINPDWQSAGWDFQEVTPQ